MHKFIKFGLIVIAVMGCSTLFGQSAQFPIVKEYGGIYEIPDATERPDPTLTYKLMVDLSTAAEDNKQISRWVDNVARLMNLHGLAGVPKAALKVKVVVHGGAIFTLLNNAQYQERFQTDNPNLKVYEALLAAGADIMVCGQSLIARKMVTKDLWPGVRVAHSALTTITTYVPQGYVLLKF
ncbi:MAG: DsrE family protein [Haliscomenobacter sp.]|uniref:DsrE family protein n=1 Tax=Haliscomenobacter sp. TaxID=2717303 RepID=UPI0029BAD945|nr:DsrE family protein [Haliscomenobacter sp.]MDX2068680.1 DsrE family protein [Haliscomenobacter sp.]